MRARQGFNSKVTAIVFFCVALQQSAPNPNTSSAHPPDILIVGAGLTGLILVHQFFDYSVSRNGIKPQKILMTEARTTFTRPQVIKLTVKVARSLPQPVILDLWPDEASRKLIFDNHSEEDFEFAINPHPRYMPHVQILNLQNLLLNYMNLKYGMDAEDKNSRGLFRIEFGNTLSCKGGAFKQFVRESGCKAIILAIGNTKYYEELRDSLELDVCQYVQPVSRDTLGITAIFKNSRPDIFVRNDKFQSALEYRNHGIYYAPTNDAERNAQVYICPTKGKDKAFDRFFEKVAYKEFVQKETFGNPKAGDPAHQSDTLKKFIAKLTVSFVKIMNKLGIPIENTQNINFFSASRREYYYRDVAIKVDELPVLVSGDSAGSTDFTKGQNVERGYNEGAFIVNEIYTNGSFKNLARLYYRYWNDVVQKDFIPKKFSRIPVSEEMEKSTGCGVSHVLRHFISDRRSSERTSNLIGKSELVETQG